ncbi:MAG TPA: hypothetical protein VFR49_05660, partial [Solirubrobacteraceae bacterium]|nr:hypothetical protein [Solirubrobacteraceae bacterium]
MTGGLRHVASELGFAASDEVVLVLQVAPATSAGELVDEHLEVTSDGRVPEPEVTEVAGLRGGRMHVVRAAAGNLSIA